MQSPGRYSPYIRRLRADSKFFFELQFCNEHGIPHSEFLKWDPIDRAKVLAFTIEKGDRCAMCGTGSWEWDAKQGGSKRAYEPVEKFCPGCYAKASVRTGMDSERNMDGVTIELARNDRSVGAARRHMSQIPKKRKGQRDAVVR